MAHKLRDSRGLTLIEMLCAVVILILLGLLINTGLNMAVKSYRDITAQSELELLLSTISDALADDLRYAKQVETNGDGTLKEYHSETYNTTESQTTTLSVKYTDGDGHYGQLYANEYRLLSSGAYGNGAYIVPENGLKITFDHGLFTIDLTVCQREGTLSAHTEFTVRCLNPN